MTQIRKRTLQMAVRKALKPFRRVFHNPILSHFKTAVKAIAIIAILGTVGALEAEQITLTQAIWQSLGCVTLGGIAI